MHFSTAVSGSILFESLNKAVKVNPGADVNTTPLNWYRSLFPKHFTPNGRLKPDTLRSTWCTWSPHDRKTQSFLGFFTSQVQHKTTPAIIPITIYAFGDFTRPYILLSYHASVHLGIVEFKVPNEASSHAVIDAITNTKEAKQVTFSSPLHTTTPSKKKTTKKQKLSHFLSLSILSKTNHQFPLSKAMRCKRSPILRTIVTL